MKPISANRDHLLFSPLMITRRCFPYIPGLDVNSFGKKKVMGQNQRSCHVMKGNFLLNDTQQSTGHADTETSHVTWGVACAERKSPAQLFSTFKQLMQQPVHSYTARSIYSLTLVKQTIKLYKRDHCSFWCPAHNHWQIDVMFLQRLNHCIFDLLLLYRQYRWWD